MMNTEDSANKYLQENKLTFADNSLSAHFLERDSRLDVKAATTTDPRMNYDGIAAGIDIGGFQSKGKVISGISTAILDKFKINQMYKSLDNLMGKGESTDNIAMMMSTVQNRIYKNNRFDRSNGITNKPSDEIKNYLDFALNTREGRASKIELDRDYREANGGSITSRPEDDRPLSEMQSLFSLGRPRSDYFGDMFSMVTEARPLDTLTNEETDSMQKFSETSLRLANMGSSLIEHGKSKELKYAMQLKC